MTQEILNTTTAFLKDKGFQNPQIGIVLGTGLGQLVNHLQIEVAVNYTDIPNFPISTVEFILENYYLEL